MEFENLAEEYDLVPEEFDEERSDDGAEGSESEEEGADESWNTDDGDEVTTDDEFSDDPDEEDPETEEEPDSLDDAESAEEFLANSRKEIKHLRHEVLRYMERKLDMDAVVHRDDKELAMTFDDFIELAFFSS